MDAKKIISFLEDLIRNNNREWFHANKSRYEEVKHIFEIFINTIIPEIATFDNDIKIKNLSAKDCLFRIYNDIRFVKNKPLYKTNMGAFMAKGGKNSGNAGYYLHIEKNNCFLGGGIYMPPSDKLKLIRQEIYYNYDEFSGILSDKNFRKYFHGLDEIKTSRIPKGFPKDFIGAEMLKYKSYTMIFPFEEKKLFFSNFKEMILEVFKTMTPLNHFINKSFINN